MAFKTRRRATRKTFGSRVRQRSAPARRRAPARRPRKSNNQTIRIVIEQPAPSAVAPPFLPEQVGAVQALSGLTMGKRSRF